MKIDEWIWGKEYIIWGYDPSHRYTFKILHPKKGREGCLSLQYHHEKSESWLVLGGVGWALIVMDGTVCTRLMHKGDIQNIPSGTIHRLMGVTDDLMVAEPSTPDRHSADKECAKDVVRLHCVHGRECEVPNSAMQDIVRRCISVTEEAIECVEGGKLPPEYNKELLAGNSKFSIKF